MGLANSTVLLNLEYSTIVLLRPTPGVVHSLREYCLDFYGVWHGVAPVWACETVCLLVWWGSPQRQSGALIMFVEIGMQLTQQSVVHPPYGLGFVMWPHSVLFFLVSLWLSFLNVTGFLVDAILLYQAAENSVLRMMAELHVHRVLPKVH